MLLVRKGRVNQDKKLDRSERAQAVFRDLDDFLSSRRSRSLSSFEFKEKFQETEKKHGYPFPTNSDYVHCKGTEAHFGGYTCGLWMVFHALTVSYYLKNNDWKAGPPGNAKEVPEAISSWVVPFVGCKECVEEFINITQRQMPIKDCVKLPADAVFYMWHYHNTINDKLHKSPREDPENPKVQFPDAAKCFDCGRPTRQYPLKQPPCGSTDGWKRRNVLDYLIDYYTMVIPHEE